MFILLIYLLIIVLIVMEKFYPPKYFEVEIPISKKISTSKKQIK